MEKWKKRKQDLADLRERGVTNVQLPAGTVTRVGKISKGRKAKVKLVTKVTSTKNQNPSDSGKVDNRPETHSKCAARTKAARKSGLSLNGVAQDLPDATVAIKSNTGKKNRTVSLIPSVDSDSKANAENVGGPKAPEFKGAEAAPTIVDTGSKESGGKKTGPNIAARTRASETDVVQKYADGDAHLAAVQAAAAPPFLI